MRQLRFYIPFSLNVGQQYELPEATARHMVRVLRLTEGDEFVLFNGDNHEYAARLIQASKKHVQVLVESEQFVNRESSLSTHLIQALSKGDKMDLTIQKAVELGVTEISPVSSERSNVSLSGPRLEKKMQHWQGVIQSACEQSWRNCLPELHQLNPLITVLEELKSSPALKLLLTPGANMNFGSLQAPQGGVVILIGPEGGLSENEIQYAQKCGFVSVSAGPRVMRTETAGIVILSVVQMLWGDLG